MFQICTEPSTHPAAMKTPDKEDVIHTTMSLCGVLNLLGFRNLRGSSVIPLDSVVLTLSDCTENIFSASLAVPETTKNSPLFPVHMLVIEGIEVSHEAWGKHSLFSSFCPLDGVKELKFPLLQPIQKVFAIHMQDDGDVCNDTANRSVAVLLKSEGIFNTNIFSSSNDPNATKNIFFSSLEQLIRERVDRNIDRVKYFVNFNFTFVSSSST